MTLKENGTTIEEIIPKDWKVLDTKTGDFNQDGILDLVFAIQNTDKNNIQLNEGLGASTIDTNPRIFGIYFGSQSGGYYQKLVSENFIILSRSPTMDEPFGGFKISTKGVLEVAFQFWYSAGSWTASEYKYKFRYQKNEFVLIGYDSNESHRGSGDTTKYSINFLSKKMSISKGNYTKEVPDTVEWKKFNLEKEITLKMLDKPFTLEFEGIYL